VIPLHVSRIGNQRVSSIEILKIRGVKMMNLFHPYRITDAGIIVDLHEPSEVSKQLFSAAVLKKGAYK
jgi:hypothetical protein